MTHTSSEGYPWLLSSGAFLLLVPQKEHLHQEMWWREMALLLQWLADGFL